MALGDVSERPKVQLSKSCVGESPPWVQIPPSPPLSRVGTSFPTEPTKSHFSWVHFISPVVLVWINQILAEAFSGCRVHDCEYVLVVNNATCVPA